jgi:hypothetical protein
VLEYTRVYSKQGDKQMTSQDDITTKAKLAQLETQYAEMLARQSKTEGSLDQLNKSIAAGNRMTNWQFIGFVVAMTASLLGGMYWSTGVLERRFDQFEKSVTLRLDLIEQNSKERNEEMKKRIDQTEKNMNARFEDLRQVVLSKR